MNPNEPVGHTGMTDRTDHPLVRHSEGESPCSHDSSSHHSVRSSRLCALRDLPEFRFPA